MNRFLLILCLSFIFTLHCTANESLDSVISDLNSKQLTKDQQVCYLINLLNDKIERFDLDSKDIIDYTQDLIKKNDLDKYLGDLLILYGNFWKYNDEKDLAIDYYNDALKLYELHDNTNKIAFTYRCIGENLRSMSQFGQIS